MNSYKKLFELVESKLGKNCENIGWLQGTLKIMKATLEYKEYSDKEKLERIEKLVNSGLEGSERLWKEMQDI